MKKDDVFYKYMAEGLASILLHTIASYEMMGRGTHNIELIYNHKKWSELCRTFRYSKLIYTHSEILLKLSEAMFKYQRWILYNHMGRIKRWDEQEFRMQYVDIIFCCCRLANKFNVSLEEGFAYTMSKIQDGEIKRH
jgi:NTP pyrophosphatase (non-canonical NTP hydrolase)